MHKQPDGTLQYGYCGVAPHKLMSLIMRRSGVLRHARMASSYDWEWDILDIKAGRVMALQLATDLRAYCLTPVQVNRSQA